MLQKLNTLRERERKRSRYQNFPAFQPMIQAWIDLLVKFLGGCPRAAEWFLDSMAADPKWPMEILIKCPIASCRQLFEKLVSQVIIQLHDKHQPHFSAPFTPGYVLDLIRVRHHLPTDRMLSLYRMFVLLLKYISDGLMGRSMAGLNDNLN